MPVLRILTDGTLTAREAMNLKRLQGSTNTLNKTNYKYIQGPLPKVNIFAVYKSLIWKMHFKKCIKKKYGWFFSSIAEKLQHLRALKNV